MYSLEELRQQNQDISDLCEVVSVLIEKKHLHRNPYVCDLMKRFKEKVWMHLVFEDNTVYAALLRHDDDKVSAIAQGFHDSARDIKHRFSDYVKHWCKPEIAETQYEEMISHSREIFAMIMKRVKYENEQMFPLVEQYCK